jgi:hypothetical protein
VAEGERVELWSLTRPRVFEARLRPAGCAPSKKGTAMKKLWCVQSPSGDLLTHTINTDKTDALDSLFDEMPEGFQTKYWKKPVSSRRAYKKLGYKAVEVTLTPTDPPPRITNAKVIVVRDETAGVMLFRDMDALAKDCKERGFDASSDYPLMMENLARGESFTTKTTLYEWSVIHDGPIPE